MWINVDFNSFRVYHLWLWSGLYWLDVEGSTKFKTKSKMSNFILILLIFVNFIFNHHFSRKFTLSIRTTKTPKVGYYVYIYKLTFHSTIQSIRFDQSNWCSLITSKSNHRNHMSDRNPFEKPFPPKEKPKKMAENLKNWTFVLAK